MDIDRQLFVDRILESENLTDQLEDDEADTLLNWGISQIDNLLEDVHDEEAAGEKINQLMHVMRGLNSLAGNPSRASQEAIADLLNRYSKMVGRSVGVEEDERRSVAKNVSEMQPGEAIQHLKEWLHAKKS